MLSCFRAIVGLERSPCGRFQTQRGDLEAIRLGIETMPSGIGSPAWPRAARLAALGPKRLGQSRSGRSQRATIRFWVLNARCSVLSAQCSVLGARCSVLGVRCSALGAPCTQHPAPGM